MNPDLIDAHRAAFLKAMGMTWAQVAERLSIDAERHPRFQAISVACAVYRANRAAKQVISPP